MYKQYVATWTIDEDLRRGNKNTIHKFIDADGNKYPAAAKLHRVSDETMKQIWELIKADNEEKENDNRPMCTATKDSK